LDILRARHGGQASSPPADLGPSSSRVIHDTESESGEEESDEDDPGVNTIHPEENDDYDKDFVVEDDDDTLGAPLEDIPLQFTRHAHKKLKEHFKDAVEWMVQNKLNPAFARDDPVYQVAFYKLEDEVKGYAGSKFVSAAWVGDFARALKARPQYNDADIPRAGRVYNSCDACNKTNHPAKFMITFSGKPYHPDTLETLSDDEDEDDERDEDDRRSRDANGNPIPPVDKQYFVGRYVFSVHLTASFSLSLFSSPSTSLPLSASRYPAIPLPLSPPASAPTPIKPYTPQAPPHLPTNASTPLTPFPTDSAKPTPPERTPSCTGASTSTSGFSTG